MKQQLDKLIDFYLELIEAYTEIAERLIKERDGTDDERTSGVSGNGEEIQCQD